LDNRHQIWLPYWTDLPDACHGCSLIYHCGCKVSCAGNCKCKKSGINCSQLCQCKRSLWQCWKYRLNFAKRNLLQTTLNVGFTCILPYLRVCSMHLGGALPFCRELASTLSS
jgi:hypothetical protein